MSKKRKAPKHAVSEMPKVRWNDMSAEDLRYIANVIEHLKAADTFNGEGKGDDSDYYGPYIAAETPATPIWRTVWDDNSRVLLGYVVKEDYGIWSFHPSDPDTQVEVYG